uniref:Methyltransferase type 11 n=1 Tax=uncultured bacterium lac146 TaxID=1447238 RepID=X2LCD1_9BACT|nr:methyltransferase type 11 [uncultured bacterium lac146]
MTQYQSFPETAGSSHSLEKLKALCLPPLKGRRFLDVGCNEGFFCGYALWDGASRSVGIDRNAAFIERAKQRFPGCEFLMQGWNELPAGPFDVILLASALHYAKDQPALVNSLMGCLAPDGVLVLEAGIHPALEKDWILVKRGIDERLFPTLLKLREVLRHYAWTLVGDSVTQSGDPVPRSVMHVRHRRPVAYLLMEASGSGKSTMARHLFRSAGVPVVSGDRLIDRTARDKLDAGPALTAAIRRPDYDNARVDVVVRRIFESRLADAYVDLILRYAGTGDFALDGYVPPEHHEAVARRLTEKGYVPVRLTWRGVGVPAISTAGVQERAQRYFESLRGTRAPAAGG